MSDDLALRALTPGSVAARIRQVDGRPVVMVETREDTSNRGALLPSDGETIAEATRLALENKVPLIAHLASSGADINEGIDAINGWGRAARQLVKASGVIPILFSVDGPAVSGVALLLGLADQVVMSTDSYAFVSGPTMVRAFTGMTRSNPELGGASVHARSTGTAAALVNSRADADDFLASILSFLPSHVDDSAPLIPTSDPVNRATPEAGAVLPTSPTGSYDVRDVVRAVVDDGEFLELRAEWANNLITGFASIGGRAIGIVANQPQSIAGTLDIPSSQKGGRFVAFCDAFNLPIVTFVDTPGFYPGKDLEWRGMIRHGAQLAFAYARATVPRINITLRKSYGGAYIVMDSKYMGNDLAFAWPTAEIAVMGATQAAEILMRRADDDERADFVNDYEERLLNPYVAAERGSIDAVIDPADTRREVASALDLLANKQEALRHRRHDNTPL